MTRNAIALGLFFMAATTAFLLFQRSSSGQDKPAAPEKSVAIKAKIADLAWMSGVWRGKDERSEYEETWSTVANGSIIGMFRSGAGDKSTFFEFETLTQEGDEVILRIRHYREKMTDADAAPQVWGIARLSANEVLFESPADGFIRRLEYRREGDTLSAHVDSQRDGKPVKFDFRMTRVK